MIINLIFDQSGGSQFASFKAGVETAASMLEQAITDPITVTIEIGWGVFPTDQSPITGGAAEAEPNFALFVPADQAGVDGFAGFAKRHKLELASRRRAA
jgi:hypothetical protein